MRSTPQVDVDNTSAFQCQLKHDYAPQLAYVSHLIYCCPSFLLHHFCVVLQLQDLLT